MWINALPDELQEKLDYRKGEALGYLAKAAGDAVPTYSMAGRLYVSKSGWGLLSVPNALVRGVFDALHEVGLELPPSGPDGKLEAHISVLRKEEVDRIGGPEKLSERGHTFRYQLGGLKKVKPAGWDEMSEVYFLEVSSPELMKLRKSYGLGEPKYPFHVSIACRRKGVLHGNDVRKSAADGQDDLLQHLAGDAPAPGGGASEGVPLGPADGPFHKRAVALDRDPGPGGPGLGGGAGGAEGLRDPGGADGRGGADDDLVKAADCGPEPDFAGLFERLLDVSGERGTMTVKPDRLAELLGHGAAAREAGGGLDGTFLKKRSGDAAEKLAELLEGGEADGMPDSGFDPEELARGLAHEREHTSDPAVAKEIAKDHLVESGEYYEKLEEVEG